MPRQRTPHALLVLLAAEAGLIFIAVTLLSDQLDLSIYRMGGTLARSGSESLYSMRDAASGLAFTYPPFAALVFVPLASLGDPGGRVVILTLSMLALGRIAWLVSINVSPRCWLAKRGPSALAVSFVVVSLLSEPVVSTINFGQINLVLAWAIAESVLGSSKSASGLLLGLAAAMKLTPLAFIGMLVATRRFLTAVIGGSVFLVTVLLGWVLLPEASSEYWWRAVWDDQRVGGVAYIGNQSLNGSIWRLAGAGGRFPVWCAAAGVVAYGAFLVVRAQTSRFDRLVVCALASLLISPISWSHHWVWGPVVVVALLRRVPDSLPLARVCLASAWTTAQLTWLIWWPAHGGDLEYTAPLLGKIVGDAYTSLAILTLLLYAVEAVVGFGAAGADASSPGRGSSRLSGRPMTHA